MRTHRGYHLPMHRRAPDGRPGPEGETPCGQRSFDRLLARRPVSAFDSYLPHTPRLRDLKPCPAQGRPGPPADPRSPSQVSDALCQHTSMCSGGHVASGRYPAGLVAYVRWIAVIVSACRVVPSTRFPQAEEASSRVSIATRFFAVWHRLRRDSLASPCGPLVVELFVREAFRLSASRRAAAGPPGPPVARSETPHASQVERTPIDHDRGPGPPGRDLQVPPRAPASSRHVLEVAPGQLQGLSLSPLPRYCSANTIGSNAGIFSGRASGDGAYGIDAQQAPVEPDEPLSRHPAPRVTTAASCTLSAVVAGSGRSVG